MIQSSADVRESGAVLSTAGYRRIRLVPRHPALHGAERTGREPRLSGPVLRHEPPLHRRHLVPHRPEFLERANAAGEPVPPLLVVPHRIRDRRGLAGQDDLAGLRRHQLSRQRVAERAPDRRCDEDGGRLAAVRIRRDRRGPAGRDQPLAVEVFPPCPTIWRSPSSTGTRCRPTRTWGSGATSGSPPRVRSPLRNPERRHQTGVRRSRADGAGGVEERHRPRPWKACSRAGSKKLEFSQPVRLESRTRRAWCTCRVTAGQSAPVVAGSRPGDAGPLSARSAV